MEVDIVASIKYPRVRLSLNFDKLGLVQQEGNNEASLGKEFAACVASGELGYIGTVCFSNVPFRTGCTTLCVPRVA